jgi:hypothetical protein
MAGELTLRGLALIALDAWRRHPGTTAEADIEEMRAIVLRIAEHADITAQEMLLADHMEVAEYKAFTRMAEWLRALADPAGRGE